MAGLGLAAAGALTAGVFATRGALRREVVERMIGQTAAVLQPVVQDRVALALGTADEIPPRQRMVAALFAGARQRGLLALAVFDEDGLAVAALPEGRGFVDLPVGDYLQLQRGVPISRLLRAGGTVDRAPELEVVLIVRDEALGRPVGFARYHFDARALVAELDVIDRRMQGQTWAILGLGALLISALCAGLFVLLRRAGREIERSDARRARAEGSLTLAAKASALGPITSHLMHGLQGSVAGLQAAMGPGSAAADWSAAQEHARRVQKMVQETVELLNDRRSALAYELSGDELGELILARNTAAARDRGVELGFANSFRGRVDNVRGSLLCLIACNLVQNAVAASPRGQTVGVRLGTHGEASSVLVLEVVDSGPGVPEPVKARLFEPGCSGRPGGSGLGLALSRLLAEQIGATLELVETGPRGSRFRLLVPLLEVVR